MAHYDHIGRSDAGTGRGLDRARAVARHKDLAAQRKAALAQKQQAAAKGGSVDTAEGSSFGPQADGGGASGQLMKAAPYVGLAVVAWYLYGRKR